MSNVIEQLTKELERRIGEHTRHGKEPFQATITSEQEAPSEGKQRVSFYVHLPKKEWEEYASAYLAHDRIWFKKRGEEHNLIVAIWPPRDDPPSKDGQERYFPGKPGTTIERHGDQEVTTVTTTEKTTTSKG